MGRAQSEKSCPLPGLLQALARPWTMRILWSLWQSGPLRFSELKRQVQGISPRVLTVRLRQLEKQHFLFRRYKTSIPPAVTYGMTEKAKRLGKILGQLEALAGMWERNRSKGPVMRKARNARRRESSRRRRS